MTNSEAVAECLFHGYVAALLARKANAVLVLDPFRVVRLAFATHSSPLARCGSRVDRQHPTFGLPHEKFAQRLSDTANIRAVAR
jgi:hypothetical protein